MSSLKKEIRKAVDFREVVFKAWVLNEQQGNRRGLVRNVGSQPSRSRPPKAQPHTHCGGAGSQSAG